MAYSVSPGKFFSCELHHEVLIAWARVRRSLPRPPLVISLDHHTDTLSVRDRLGDWPEMDYRSDDSVNAAIAQLHHDEHFDFAVHCGVIRGAVIVSHVPDPEPNPDVRVFCDRDWPDMNILLNDPERFRPLADGVLETDFLARRLEESGTDFLQEPYILDVDLDYLLTAKAFRPDDSRLFLSLIAHAQFVTVSREREWVRLLKLDSELPDLFAPNQRDSEQNL